MIVAESSTACATRFTEIQTQLEEAAVKKMLKCELLPSSN